MLSAVFWSMLFVYAFHITSASTVGGDASLLPDLSYGSTCEVGWTLFQGSCYKQLYSSRLTWQSARRSCQNVQADLVVVKNDAENNFLVTTFKTRMWIGLTDKESEGTFKWIPTGTEPSYTNFFKDEPNNQGNEDCVELNSVQKGKWNDLPCTRHLNYVCQKGIDYENPRFNGCPENMIVDTFPGADFAEVSWNEPDATDNGRSKPVQKSHSPGDIFELKNGTSTVYTVRYAVQDYSSNEAECYFNITINDNEPPDLQCPQKTSNYHTTNYGSIIYASTDDGSPNGTITWTPLVAKDNSGLPPIITSFPYESGDIFPTNGFPPYTTTIRATDESGNSKECQIHFVVVDIESPVVICPSHSNNFVARTSESSWSVFTDGETRSARLYWSPANATDNSGTVVSVTSNHNPGDVFSLSDVAHQITYTAIDGDNNVGNCSFYITVKELENPSIECPSHLQVYTDDGSRFAFLSWNITLKDNVAVVHCMSNDSRIVPDNLTLNHTSITLAQNGSFSIGINLVEYVAKDMSGNIGKCLLTITVIDNERPSITCPSNISNYYDHIFAFHRLVADYGRPYATVTWSAPEFHDNSQESVRWESFPYTSGDTFPLQQFPPYDVKLTASDMFGNNRSCYIYFTVIDIEPPTITCPTNITNYYDTYYGIIRAALDPGSSTSTVTWDDPTVSDNSGRHVNVTSSYQSGERFAPRFYPPYEVEYIAEDASGNKNSCKFYFLVTDNDSKVTSNNGTVSEHTTSSAVKAVSSTSSTVTNMDVYNTDKYKNVTESALESASPVPLRMSTSSSPSPSSLSSSSSTRQVTDQQTTSSPSNIKLLSTKVTIISPRFPTTLDTASSLQNESNPTVPSVVFISKNTYKTADDNIYNPTSSYNLMTSRFVGYKFISTNNGIDGVTIVIICLCILGILSFLIVIAFIIKKKRHNRPKSDTNLHSSNASVLDFENPACEMYHLQNLDKEFGTSKTEEGISNCGYV